MENSKHDRRSQRTRQALMDALIALLSEKEYDAISINDIITRANVGRSTFYGHFQTKDDLLKQGFERVLDFMIEQVSFNETARTLRMDTTPLFRHAQEHYDLFKTLVWGSGFDILSREGHAALTEKIHQKLKLAQAGKPQPAVPLNILAYATAASLLTLLKWWLELKMPYPPERMDEIFQQFTLVNVRNLMGLTD